MTKSNKNRQRASTTPGRLRPGMVPSSAADVTSAESLFREIELFRDLAKDEIREIARSTEHCVFEAGELLFRQADEATAMFVVESGELEVRATTSVGEDVILAVLSAGSVVGEMALLEGSPRSASVKALSKTHAFRLSRDAFTTLRSARSPSAYKLILNLARNLGERRRQTDARVTEVFGDPTQHIDAFENQAHGLLARIRKA
jgi:CRP/FNR family transcriptional regulator, cyclic AMP receptor protein